MRIQSFVDWQLIIPHISISQAEENGMLKIRTHASVYIHGGVTKALKNLNS